MLFIGRTMNKETQLGRKEKGREKGGNPRSCAYYLWNLTVITESVLCKCVRMRVFSHWLCACFHVQSCRKKCPSRSDVLVQIAHCGCAWFGAPLLLKAGVTVQYSYSRI